MTTFFKRAHSAAALQSEVAKLRDRRSQLTSQLTATKGNIVSQQEKVEALLMTEKPDLAVVQKAERSIVDAEQTVRSLSGVIARLDDDIIKADAGIAEAAAAAQRKAAAAVHEADLRQLHPAASDFVDAARKLATVTGRIGVTIFDAKQLHSLVQAIVDEIPTATERLDAQMRAHVRQIMNGTTSAVLPKPELVPAPISPSETKRVFSMAPLSWGNRPGEFCARHQDVEMPVWFATRALSLGYAIEMTDNRWKTLRTGFAAAPSLSDCVDLTDENSAPLRPLFGDDRLKKDAQFRETIGPNRQSWINAERT